MSEKKETKYYSCHYLLSLKDKEGKLPAYYITDGNRTAGKSVSFKRHLVDNFLRDPNGRSKFLYVVRNKSDLENLDEAFFADIGRLFYRDHSMSGKLKYSRNVLEFYLDERSCGYGVALSMTKKYKPISGIFTTVKHIFFDEYQDEDNRYLSNEIQHFQSLYASVARGDGEQMRRVPVYMASNTISILNPYYNSLGIDKLIKSNTKILRGNGWVYQKHWNKSAAESLENNPVLMAHKGQSYFKTLGQNIYLNDNMSLVEKVEGNGQYFLSIKYNQNWYNARRYGDMVYISLGADFSFPTRVCFVVDDVTDDRAEMIGTNNFYVLFLRDSFYRGLMRFHNSACKLMALDLLRYL